MIGYLIVIGVLMAWLLCVRATAMKRKAIINSLMAQKFKIGKQFYVVDAVKGKIIVGKMTCHVIEVRENSVMLGYGEIITKWFNATRCFSTEKSALDNIEKQIYSKEEQ